MGKLVVAVIVAGAVGVGAAIYSVHEIQHRQRHSENVATVAAAKTANKVANTAVKKATKSAAKTARKVAKTAVKAAAKTAAKKVKTAQEEFNDDLVASQIKACKRGNVLRRTVNSDTLVIQAFMRLAAAQYAKVNTPFAQQRAAQYRKGAAALRLVPLPKCGSVIVRPSD